MRNYLIVDLDGTLCDNSHRQHLALAKQWEEFHSLLHEDKLCKEVVAVIRGLYAVVPDLSVVAVTGRNERYRERTLAWKKLHEVDHMFDDLLMRPDDDYTKDEVLKIKMIEDYFGSKENVLSKVLLALDDRTSVVNAFRDYGIIVFQVREGDF